MTVSFPEEFSLSELQGPRGRQFQDRANAFQQLIGDALLEAHSTDGAVIPTTLGHDGCIDAFLSRQARDRLDLARVHYPAIIECKSHDPTSHNLTGNIRRALNDTCAKIKQNTAGACLGDYAPWARARSFLYVISVKLSCPNTYLELQKTLDELSTHLKTWNPEFNKALLLDWAKVRAWLDRLPRVADKWLGISVTWLRGHEGHCKGLRGTSSFLLQKELPFVAPPCDSQSHPTVLMERVRHLSSLERGLLLVGPGGVGKTRTLMEVGEFASREGWRVLHATRSESGEEVGDKLCEELLQASSDTLLLCDHFEDLGWTPTFIRNTLFPAVSGDLRLAVLGCCRPPVVMRKADRSGLAQVFDVVEMSSTDWQARLITQQIVAWVAPDARALLGEDEMVRVCGFRPMIALFVARQLQQLADARELRTNTIAHFQKEGELAIWLRVRLQECDLAVQPAADLFSCEDPKPQVVAAAAALAAAPQLEECLRNVVNVALGEESTRHSAKRIIAVLKETGWLETRSGGTIAACHDAVTDVLLEEILRVETGADIRTHVLTRLLGPCKYSSQTTGHMATSLGRLLGQRDDTDGLCFEAAIESAANDWFRANLASMNECLLHDDADISSVALGAIISTFPWAPNAMKNLLGSWLETHGKAVAARNLLYIGLRQDFDAEMRKRLTRAALAWLSLHSSDSKAGFVLYELLKATDLTSCDADTVIELARRWLWAFGSKPYAHYVLGPLLKRLAEGGFPFTRGDVMLGIHWLRIYAHRMPARFVFSKLLNLADLGGHEAEVAELGVAWVEEHKRAAEARYVLQPLLARGDLGPAIARKAEMLALEWLEFCAATTEAPYVAESMLNRGSTLEGLAAITIDCLLQHPQHQATPFVLRSLRKSILFSTASEQTLREVVDAVGTCPAEIFPRLIQPLLRLSLSDDVADRLWKTTAGWLVHNPNHARFSPVLADLVAHPIDVATLNSVVGVFAQRLQTRPPGRNETRRNRTIRRIVERGADLTSERKNELVSAALHLWREHAIIGGIQAIEPILRDASRDEQDARKALVGARPHRGEGSG